MYLYRPEYQAFSLDVFRAHIYQEARTEVETPYWMGRRLKKLKQQAARLEPDQEGDDLDFFDDYYDDNDSRSDDWHPYFLGTIVVVDVKIWLLEYGHHIIINNIADNISH